jgi:LysM repeat protein
MLTLRFDAISLLRRCVWLLVPAMLVGCGGVPWTIIKQSGPPSALKGSSQVAVFFDYTGMQVGGMGGDKPEAQWVAEKSVEEADYATTWATLKGNWEQNVLSAFTENSPLAVKRGTPGTPPPDSAAVVTFTLNNLQMGKYMVFGATQSGVTVTHTWGRHGAIVDEIQTRTTVTPGITNPSIQQHVVDMGETTGKLAAKFLERALEE